MARVVPGHAPPSAEDREFFGDEVAEHTVRDASAADQMLDLVTAGRRG